MSSKKVGGIRFIRIGRLSLSYSIAKPKTRRDESLWALDAMIGVSFFAFLVALI